MSDETSKFHVELNGLDKLTKEQIGILECIDNAIFHYHNVFVSES